MAAMFIDLSPSLLPPPPSLQAHPRFYNQLFSGVDMGGLCGVMLTCAANTGV